MRSISLSINHHKIDFSKPIIMGILNLTPDSFYDGGEYKNEDILNNKLKEFNDHNVQIIDIGSESSRPGAEPISATDEINRLSPYLQTIKNQTSAIISVDTYKSETAHFALDNGATIINDISGGECDQLLRIVSQYDAGIVLMHKQGSPTDMQLNPQYENVIDNVKSYLKNQVDRAKSFGIQSIIIDPGIGFGKTLDHNCLLLKHLDQFSELNTPILIGTSNKSFISQISACDPHERLPGSLASIIGSYQKGAHIFRVHNVKETVQAFDVFRAIYE